MPLETFAKAAYPSWFETAPHPEPVEGRPPHHEGYQALAPHPEEPRSGVSKDEAALAKVSIGNTFVPLYAMPLIPL
ncbi:MAG: hypothetical protein HY765_09380 [Rhodomicrobium sp.]|nr:hypothetical protein [Rhodomicrobium sp.]